MPSPEATKIYLSDTCYHVYNRGVNRERIFFQENDYWAYRRILQRTLRKQSFFEGRVELKAFALMPNHFHLLIYQQCERDLPRFMRSVSATYSVYIRNKYSRIGHLYQGVYKAVTMRSERHQKEIQGYILANPLEAGLPSWRHVGKEP